MAFNNFQALEYWDAAANKPKLVSGKGEKGRGYIVSVAGTTNLDGNAQWVPGDVVMFGLDQWLRFTPLSASVLSALFNSLPTTLPSAPGVVWNNGGSISIS